MDTRPEKNPAGETSLKIKKLKTKVFSVTSTSSGNLMESHLISENELV